MASDKYAFTQLQDNAIEGAVAVTERLMRLAADVIQNSNFAPTEAVSAATINALAIAYQAEVLRKLGK